MLKTSTGFSLPAQARTAFCVLWGAQLARLLFLLPYINSPVTVHRGPPPLFAQECHLCFSEVFPQDPTPAWWRRWCLGLMLKRLTQRPPCPGTLSSLCASSTSFCLTALRTMVPLTPVALCGPSCVFLISVVILSPNWMWCCREHKPLSSLQESLQSRVYKSLTSLKRTREQGDTTLLFLHLILGRMGLITRPSF